MKILKITALCALLTIILSISAFPQKMKPEDILAKHLDSIGTAEARAANSSRVMIGTAEARFINPKRSSAIGKIVLASAGEKTFWALNLDKTDYPQEKFGFDGKKVKVNYIKTGLPSTLGEFVNTNETIIEESLFGGALSTSWALLNMANKKAKLSYEGTKKVGDKQNYVIEYRAKSSDLNIRLYFDTETFQHTRTEYKKSYPAPMGRIATESSSQKESYLKVVETFSDFKKEQNLTLPHSYDLNYTFTGPNASTEISWIVKMTAFLFDQKMEDSAFDIEAN